MPFVRPVTEQLSVVAGVSQVNAPGDRRTMYPVTSEPPLEVGADQLTSIAPSSAVATTDVGAVGVVNGTTVTAVLVFPAPAALVARTVTE